MFALAILIGIYSYGIFALGVIHFIYPITIILFTVAWLFGVIWWFRRDNTIREQIKDMSLSIKKLNFFSKLLLVLLVILWSINLIGVLAPEISFDALWYHLTIPKIFVQHNSFFYIPGGLYYYSLMPKLVDLLYIPSVMINSAVGAKLIHYMFGILTLIVLYKISRYYLSQALSLLVIFIFSSSLVVAWEATTAYIDLGRTFFEVMAVYGLIRFVQEKKELWLIESAIMLGLAIATKLIAIGSLMVIVSVLIFLFRSNLVKAVKISALYSVIAFLVPLPYFIFAYLQTGNPVYPLFTEFYTTQLQSFSLLSFPSQIWSVFVVGSDPINPLYIIVLPLLFFVWSRFSNRDRLIGIYVIASLIVWLITPRTGGGRFLLPYLPIFSLFVVMIITRLQQPYLRNAIIFIAIIVGFSTIGYRGIASAKYIPVIIGTESKEEFLKNNLNFQFGDFYDTTGYFAENINIADRVLIYGVHNLWYVNFPFVHESYIQEGDEFNYILAPSDMVLPERFSVWKPQYVNGEVGVTLYSQGGNRWVY